MSKEQTPITAEGIKDDIRSILTQRYGTRHNPHDIATDKIFNLINAKVLEALEREVVECWLESVKESFRQEGRVFDDEFLGLAKNDAKKYYETEVKPKYK